MPDLPPRIRHVAYTRERLARTADRLLALVHPERQSLDELQVAPRSGRITHAQAQELSYRPAAVGERFGPLWATYWFRAAATVPAAWAGSRVDLLWRTGTESTLWIGGRPRQGLSTGEGFDRPDAVLLDAARGGEHLRWEIELACNGPFGAPFGRPAPASRRTWSSASSRASMPEAWELAHDFRVLQELEADADGAWIRRGPASCSRG
jgi:hypothetical protein